MRDVVLVVTMDVVVVVDALAVVVVMVFVVIAVLDMIKVVVIADVDVRNVVMPVVIGCFRGCRKVVPSVGDVAGIVVGGF